MKIKNLLLGSVVAMGLSTGAAFAADPLGVLTSLDVCDSLGLSGLTISSDTNCLTITGRVVFQYGVVFEEGDESADEEVELDWRLKFDAANDTEFGPAHAVITIQNGDPLASGEDVAGQLGVEIREAYVSIGDTTALSAGYKTSILDDFTTEGFVLTNESLFSDQGLADDGSIFATETSTIGDTTVDVGDLGLTVVHSFGDGFTAGIGVESLETSNDPNTALVGYVAVEQEMWSGYLAGAIDEITKEMDAFEVAAGVSAEFDAFSFAAAGYYADNEWDDAYLEALISAQAELDIVTLAAEFFYSDDDETAGDGAFFTATGSASFGVTDAAEIAFSIKYENNEDLMDTDRFGGQIQVVAEISDTLEATALAYAWDDDMFGAEASLVWDPDGDDNFEATVYAGYNTPYWNGDGAFYVGTEVQKLFE